MKTLALTHSRDVWSFCSRRVDLSSFLGRFLRRFLGRFLSRFLRGFLRRLLGRFLGRCLLAAGLLTADCRLRPRLAGWRWYLQPSDLLLLLAVSRSPLELWSCSLHRSLTDTCS